MEWKGAKDWAIERDSIANKMAYARRWGYHVELIDMMTKKRYAHEWRESWEKIDTLQDAMRKYPHAEWQVLPIPNSLLTLPGFGGWILIHL
jgi:mannan polymerase II complex MNN10 subunit